MFHFIKYLFLALFIFVFLNLFRSNMDVMVALKFDLPLVWSWSSIPVGVTYLLLVAFCVGIIFAALVGAFRMAEVRAQKRELKKLRLELRDATTFSSSAYGKKEDMPSLG
jgi:uncharacterized integral membrane protein